MEIKKYITDIFHWKYFQEENVHIVADNNEENNVINVHPEFLKQNWLGLGGALTNATLHNYEKLSDDKKKALINNYYKDLNYNFLRLPIGSTDFSTHPDSASRRYTDRAQSASADGTPDYSLSSRRPLYQQSLSCIPRRSPSPFP